ncbi:MAG: SRPBCC family protein [Anaerolineae bacterium]|nr:SRPBCC family protein [Phycisphaerae bacterium]
MKNVLKVTTPTETQIVVTRTFDAPRKLVWEAMSKPELIKRWLFGPPGWEMTQCDDDMRVGGKFRWAWRGPNGEQLAMSGTYSEVTPPSRVARTESFEMGCDAQAGQQVATIELTEQADRTQMTVTLVYPSKEARDGALASGMEHGMAAGYDRLDEMIVTTTK